MSAGDGVTGQWGGVDVHFGEEGGRLTYGSYLRLAELLDQQRLESEPPAHDELLFITIHQVYELWFKQLLHEGAQLQRRLEAGDTPHALHTVKRMLTILKTVVAQIDVLETMTPRQFLTFRDRLEAGREVRRLADDCRLL
jgi:tryptophan 2,3-dioxygenase